jgi:uncharacterized protein YndB with AHSA1/START domain/DNA-binding transcriptional ArsR family regulator
MENMMTNGILSTVDPQRVLAALAEPNRLRIVELLAGSPRTVGEIALALDIRQPQTTKHLQTLESAGVVVVHQLGKRRVAALQRAAVRDLADRLAVLGVAHPSETVLEQYERATRIEEQRLSDDGSPSGQTIRVERTLAASPAAVWQAWTTPDLVRRWWSPEHFEVVECDVEAVVGGSLRVTIEEVDGARYTSSGEVLGLDPGHRLIFSQAPLDADGAPMFSAIHELVLEGGDAGTLMSLTINVRGGTEVAAAALAGIPIGWQQCFDKMAATIER